MPGTWGEEYGTWGTCLRGRLLLSSVTACHLPMSVPHLPIFQEKPQFQTLTWNFLILKCQLVIQTFGKHRARHPDMSVARRSANSEPPRNSSSSKDMIEGEGLVCFNREGQMEHTHATCTSFLLRFRLRLQTVGAG